MAKDKKLTALEAVLKVLGDSGKPMRMPDLIKAAVPLTALSGKTPGQSIYSVTYEEAKRTNPRVKQTAKGTFQIVRANVTKAEKAAEKKAEEKTSKPATTRRTRTASKPKEPVAAAA